MSNDFSTSQSGAPIASNEYSLTTGPDGVTVLHDRALVEKLASFNRERVPERNPHAKGGGAFGEFTVTEDVSMYTRAAVFQPGTTSEMLLRFSSVAGEQGSPATDENRSSISDVVPGWNTAARVYMETSSVTVNSPKAPPPFA